MNTEKEHTVAFVVARLTSSRFPRKQLRQIGEKTVLLWIIDSLKKCTEIDQIVIATVAQVENLPLKKFAADHGIDCFWYEGNVDHVTTRLTEAAKHYNASICLLISGDCPLVHAPLLDHLLYDFKMHPECDVLHISPPPPNTKSAIEGIGIARRSAWNYAEQLSNTSGLKEHQFPIISSRPDLFTAHVAEHPSEYSGLTGRFSLDTFADLCFLNRIYEKLKASNKEFCLPEALLLVEREPNLLEINCHVCQRTIDHQIHYVLFYIDCGDPFGYGHLMRSIELALQITERLSWPVTFVVDDIHSYQILQEKGFICYWGAFERPTRNFSSSLESPFQQSMLSKYSLVILDVAARTIPLQWRSDMPNGLTCLVIDKVGEWAMSADCVIIPGVTADPQNLTRIGWEGGQSSPPIFYGKEYVILRREIIVCQSPETNKVIDLLMYSNSQIKEQVHQYYEAYGKIVREVNGQEPDFPLLLAQAKIYMSHFGLGFYEALALKTLPICLAGTEIEEQDARRFYNEYGLAADKYILRCDHGRIAAPLPQMEELMISDLPMIQNGTERIVEKVKEIVPARKGTLGE
jgi:spore coat polysaccharide biosynthesis protein SpsF